MANVLGHAAKVYPDIRQGLMSLLAYALNPRNRHSRQWAVPLIIHLSSRDTVPVHRCTVCGRVFPCKCWD
jgi:hypothetical protein